MIVLSPSGTAADPDQMPTMDLASAFDGCADNGAAIAAMKAAARTKRDRMSVLKRAGRSRQRAEGVDWPLITLKIHHRSFGRCRYSNWDKRRPGRQGETDNFVWAYAVS